MVRLATLARSAAAAAKRWSPQPYTGGGVLTASGMKRTCFQLKFESSDLKGYLKDHEAVWPEMQQALVDCGWHNYSLFYREDGLAVGFFETPIDFETACAEMDDTAINPTWQQAMAKYTAKDVSPIDQAQELTNYFYLGTNQCDYADVAADHALALPVWQPQTYTGGGRLTGGGLKRCCFQMTFDTSDLAQYRKDHEAVWPEMQQALVESGWYNYSLYYRKDGFAVGYFETDTSFEECCAKMDKTGVNATWQEAMSKYTPVNTSPIDAAKELTHYFYLGNDVEA